jgi:DNA mismatch endonuclease (patch repair protein)
MTPSTKRRPKHRDEIARNMSAIRSRDNRTESQLRRVLHGMGFRYRKYSPGLIGRPDIVFPTEKVAVFVDGDYWHGRMVREGGIETLHRYYTSKQQTYWVAKLSRNVARDDRVTAELQALGWKVLRFWEGDIKKDVAPAARHIAATVRRRRSRTNATR